DLLLPEAFGLEDDVERLVPGHIAQLDGDGALDVVGDVDVPRADLGDAGEQVLDFDVLEVEVGPAPRVVAIIEHAALAHCALLGSHGGCAPGRRSGRLRLGQRVGLAQLPGEAGLGRG